MEQRTDQGPAKPVETAGVCPAWVLGFGLLTITFLAYLPVWRAGFIWDDDTFLLNNPLIQKADGLWQFWFSTAAPDYFPMTSSTLWLEWRLWGANALGYHLVNVSLHSLSALLLWRILIRLKIPGAILAAALFAVHPVNVESVAWITERKNTLSMVFYLLSIFWYLRSELAREVKQETGGASPPLFSGKYYWLALGAFALALLSKSAVVPLPVVLLGLVWWHTNRVSVKDIVRTVPFFVLAGAAAVASIWFQYHRAIGASMVAVRHDSFWSRLAGAGWAVWFYLWKACVPLNLSFVYPRWHVDGARLVSYVPDVLLLAVFLVCWWQRQRGGKAVLFALGYFVLLLLPILGFINIYFMRYALVADHWQYFAIIGPVTLGAAAITFLVKANGSGKIFAWPERGIGVGLVVLFGVLTWEECRTYRDVETLWIKTLERNPNATLALNNLGNLRLQQGRLEEASAHFRKALQIQPDAPDVLSNMGAVLLRQGDLAAAAESFRKALALEPDSAQAHNNLGTALLQQGKADEAVTHFQAVAKIQPDQAAIEQNLGNALLRSGQTESALSHLQRAVTLQPGLADARLDLGNALLGVGQTDAALVQLGQAAKLQPRLAAAHFSLGNAWFQHGDLVQALAEFQNATEIDPVFAGARNGLGNVFLRQGDPEKAQAQFQQALMLAPNLAEARFNLGGVLLAKGEVDAAIVQLEKGLALQPHVASAHNNLASALLRKGRADDAIVHLKAALEIQPSLPEAQNNLGNALLGKGKAGEAVGHYEAAIAALPGNPYLLNNLAWVLATCPDDTVRNGVRAVELAKQADALVDGKSPAFLGTLAAAYAELGKYSEAVRTAQRALELATSQNNASQIGSLRERVMLYQSGSPFRDSELAPRKN